MTVREVDIVGLTQIAERLEVQPDTAYSWRDSLSSGFPKPDGQLAARQPWWHWDTVRAWAVDSGRLVEGMEWYG